MNIFWNGQEMKKKLEVFDDRVMLCDGCVYLFLPQFWGLAAWLWRWTGIGSVLYPHQENREGYKETEQKVNDLCGMKESDTGLAVPSEWDLVSDKQMMQEEQPLQVARCTSIINDSKYVINVKQIARFVVGLGDKVSTMDIEEGMHVGYILNISLGLWNLQADDHLRLFVDSCWYQ
jgi:hypothetical protein